LLLFFRKEDLSSSSFRFTAVAVCKSRCILPRDTPSQIAKMAKLAAWKRLLKNDFTGKAGLAPGLHGNARIGRSAHAF
jgi:hypothetical protein